MDRLKDELRLSPREIRAFINNAQIALCEALPDEFIPVVYSYKNQLVRALKDSKLPPGVLAAILVSAAWDIFEQEWKRLKK